MASTDLDAAGLANRIEELLDGIAESGGPGVAHSAEELVRVLMRFYGAGLEQVVSAGLLALHDLHPVPLAERLEHALATARRRLGSHGSGITLGEIDADGAVHVQLEGGGCGSDTVKDVVAGAIGELAPDVAGVVFDMAPAGPALLQIGFRK